MDLTHLKKITTKREKRRGQGHGSGRVKTAGRGQKGQKVRGNIPLFFEGGALPLIKRLPFMRGRDSNHGWREKPVIVNVDALNVFPKGSTVDPDALIKQGLVGKQEFQRKGVKVLGDGKLEIALKVKLPVSSGAKVKIEKAGGSIE